MGGRKRIPPKIRRQVYEKYGGHCAYCGQPVEYKDMQVDHINSVERFNGADDISNYNPSCRMCNFYKSTYTLEEFRQQLYKLRERLEKVYIYRLSRNFGLITENKSPVTFYFERQEAGRMTNEEAINDLKEFWNWFCCTYPNSPYADERINYAFSMAFDALERCEDVDPYLAQWLEIDK